MGAWQEIVDYTVPSNITSFTLNNFGTITKDDFIKITCSLSSANSTAAAYYQLFVNTNETNSNYWRQELQALGTTVQASRFNFPNIGITVNNATTTINTFLKISQNDKVNTFSNGSFSNSSDVRIMYDYTTSLTNHPSITSITIKGTFSALDGGGILSNSIAANSRIQIYKLTAQKVADVVVNANTTQVDITGLDIKKGDEYLLVSDVNYTSSTADDLHLFINNNLTLNNYNRQAIFGVASSAGANRNASPSYIYTNGNTKTMAYTHIKLSNIGSYTYQSYNINDSESSNIFLHNFFGSSTAENITNINALNIRSVQSNAIGATTRFQLYKLYEGGN